MIFIKKYYDKSQQCFIFTETTRDYMSNCIKDITHNEAFELLTESELLVLENNKTSIKYDKGEVLIKQGTLSNSIIFVKKGISKIYIEGSQKNIILTIKRDNNFLGLSSLYTEDKTYQYTVSALEKCKVELYDKMAFKEVLKSNVAFSNEIIKYINHNTSRFYKRLLCITEKNSRGKVADMILCLSNHIFGCIEFTIPLSRQELAEFAGLSMENTIRILKEFEADKLIKLKGKSFKIKNKSMLERISEFG